MGVKADSVEALRWVISGSKAVNSEKLKEKFTEVEQELRANLPGESVARAEELAECCLRGEAVASSSAEGALAGKALAEDLNCVGCHGDNGISDHDKIPNFAGQRPEYLRAQLWLLRSPPESSAPTFNRTSARRDRLMTDIAVSLSDQNIVDIAAYYAGLPCESRPAVDMVEPPPKSERCASCHGGAGRSQRGGFPHIAGQKEGYLKRQLTLLRNSIDAGPAVIEDVDIRHHGLMAPQAGSLSTNEVDALARYYAGPFLSVTGASAPPSPLKSLR